MNIDSLQFVPSQEATFPKSEIACPSALSASGPEVKSGVANKNLQTVRHSLLLREECGCSRLAVEQRKPGGREGVLHIQPSNSSWRNEEPFCEKGESEDFGKS